MSDPASPQSNRQWLWILAGVAYGLLLRILFAAAPRMLDRNGGVMSFAFLVITPMAVGAITVYGARHSHMPITRMAFTPWLSILLMMLGAALSLLEGSICIVLLTPLFLACGSIGGLLMGGSLRLHKRQDATLKAVTLLPFVVFLGEAAVPQPDRHVELRSSIVVQARPETVWSQILTARDIRPGELPFSLSHFIGVPKPIEGVNVTNPEGENRYSLWERGVNFRGAVTNRRDNQTIAWRYIFDDKSFPPGSMDEHVAIGGRYFNLHDTTFNLQNLANGQTRLEIVAHYRVTTSINFYAVPLANLLGQDFAHTILGLYKHRSECAEGRRTEC